MERKILVWKGWLDGECKLIAESEEDLRTALAQSCWFTNDNRNRWKVASEFRHAPVVLGALVFTENGCNAFQSAAVKKNQVFRRPHVLWRCPICESEHVGDLEPGERITNLALGDRCEAVWCCENGTCDDVVIVQWCAGPAEGGLVKEVEK